MADQGLGRLSGKEVVLRSYIFAFAFLEKFLNFGICSFSLLSELQLGSPLYVQFSGKKEAKISNNHVISLMKHEKKIKNSVASEMNSFGVCLCHGAVSFQNKTRENDENVL